MSNEHSLVLAFFPSFQGFGYVCLENQNNLLDYGVARVRPFFSDKILKRMITQIDFFRPTILIMQDYDSKYSHQGKRVHSVIDAAVAHAKAKNLPVYQYTREQIRDTFEVLGAKSKYEIIQSLLTWFPELIYWVPGEPKTWQAEGYSTCMFDALALAVTHNHRKG